MINNFFPKIKPVKSEAQEEMERNGATVEIGFPLKSEILIIFSPDTHTHTHIIIYLLC